MRRISVLLLFISLVLCACSSGQTQGLKKVGQVRVDAGYDVCVEGEYAYVANNDGVTVIDVSDPRKPKEVSEISTDGALGIYVEGNLAYIAGIGRGLIIADVSDPTDPQVLGSYADGGLASQVHVSGSYAYLADHSDGLEIIDVSDPTQPTKIAVFRGSGSGEGVDGIDGIVYFANGGRLDVVDVSDPQSPQKIRTVSGTGGAWDVHVYGEFLYLGCHNRGLKIMSLADKESPKIIGSFFDGGESQGVWGNGKYLYVADNYSVEVLDITDPTAPEKIAERRASAAHDIFSDGTYIYVAEASPGLRIFEYMESQE